MGLVTTFCAPMRTGAGELLVQRICDAAHLDHLEVILASRTWGRLDAKLKTLDARAASSLEKLVRDALELVEGQNGGVRSERLPSDFFTRIAREFGSEPFERPPQ